MADKVIQNNPGAVVFIYNYRDRTGTADFVPGSVFDVEQIILNTTSLISVTTQRSKGSPAGSFEITLAPTKNWIAAITPGSWICILMSNQKLDDTAKYGGGRVDPKTFKMLGRIDSVRGSRGVNQANGATESNFIVSGQDWGAMFLNKFYMDPLARAPFTQAVGTADRFGYDDYLLKSLGYAKKVKQSQWRPPMQKSGSGDVLNKFFKDLGIDDAKAASNVPEAPIARKINLPSAKQNVSFILEKLWGQTDPVNAYLQGTLNRITKPQQEFRIPKKLAEYMQFKDAKGGIVTGVAQMIKQKSGVLTELDKYSDEGDDAGIINFETILGEHTLWQILIDNSNNMINELIPEIRFENDIPTFTIYNRVRPFVVSSNKKIKQDDKALGDGGGAYKGDLIDKFISRFKNIRRIKLDLDDIISIDFGNNWRDRVNFIEVNIARSLHKDNYGVDIKEQSQFVDSESIGRDGLLPMMASTTYVPKGADFLDPLATSTYKYLLKEWHFNTHKMLNGRITLVGQDQYIQVGDNIIVDADCLGVSNNISRVQADSKINNYLLAHVESISHVVQVDSNGARNFITNISFVRGIITDINGEQLTPTTLGGERRDAPGAVDQDTNILTPSAEKNTNVFGTSSGTGGKQDPDRQKLKGK